MPLFLSISFVLVSYAEIPIELVGQWGGACYTVAIRDNYAYIGRGPSLLILDISEPANPDYVICTKVGAVIQFIHTVIDHILKITPFLN